MKAIAASATPLDLIAGVATSNDATAAGRGVLSDLLAAAAGDGAVAELRGKTVAIWASPTNPAPIPFAAPRRSSLCGCVNEQGGRGEHRPRDQGDNRGRGGAVELLRLGSGRRPRGRRVGRQHTPAGVPRGGPWT